MCIFYKQYFYGFLFMILGLITTKALVKSIHTEEGLELLFKQRQTGQMFGIMKPIRGVAINPTFHRIWLDPREVNIFLRTRRSNIPSITNECCTKVGCTWEEYAEYCPSNKRRNHY
uniref:Uncharacterized protein n=1 Tax=Glossina morsitans morsitans TaxID=37546 RepID=A0A1B0FMR1_GLOMM